MTCYGRQIRAVDANCVEIKLMVLFLVVASEEIMSYSPGSGGGSRISTSADVSLSNPASGDVLSFNSTLSKWENVASTAGGGNRNYVIAASDSSASEQATADLVLTSGQDVGAAVNTAVTNGYRRIELTEGTFTQTAAMTDIVGVDDFTLIGQPTKTVWMLGVAPTVTTFGGPYIHGTRTNIGTARYPSSSPAGASTNGTATFNGNLAKGARTVALNEDLTGQLSVGDLIGIASTEPFNTNRTDQFFKGEFARVLAITSSLLTLETGLRDSYIASQAYIDKYATIKRTTISGITFRGNTYSSASTIAVRIEWAENILFDRCQVDTGFTLQQGLAAYTCLGVTFRRCFVQDCYDTNASNGSYQGYGMYTAGCENVLNDHPRGLRCRHMQDDGGFNNHLVGRHIRVIGGRSEHTNAAGFSNHNVEHSSFENCYAISCGGGFALRGTKNRVIGCRVYGSSSELGPYSAAQSTAHGIILGEPDRDATSTYGISSLGPCGTDLVVDDFIFDATGYNNNSGTFTGTANGIYAYDPLINANLSNVRVTPTGAGLYFIGDYNSNVTIRDYTFDGSSQFSVNSSVTTGARNAIRFEGPGDPTSSTGNTDILIENAVIKNCRDAAIFLAAGQASNLAPDRVNIREVKVLALGTGATSTTAQFTIGEGSYGSAVGTGGNLRAVLTGAYYFDKATLTNLRFTTTTKASVYATSNATSGATIVLDDITYSDGSDGYQGGVASGSFYTSPMRPVTGELKLPFATAVGTDTRTSSDQNVMFMQRYEGFGQTFSGVDISITSPISGGTGFQMVAAVYADDGTGSRPALAAPLQVLGTFTDFTNGLKNIAVSWTEPSGPYWVGHVMQYTGVPTTFPTWNTVQNNILMPNTALNSINRCWKQAGVSGTPSTLTSIAADGTSRLAVGLKV
jgi:hypothetical protein